VRDLAGMTEQNPHNSRLIRIDGRPFEEIYRAGDRRRKIPAGRYAAELSRVIQRLQDAQLVAPRPQREYLAALIEHFQSGDGDAFRKACQRWTFLDLPVLAGLGFLDVSLDPRRQKAVFSGMAGVRDAPPSALLDSLMAQWREFEQFLPEKARPEKPFDPPRATAVQLLAFGGRHAASCPVSFFLPREGASGDEPPQRLALFSNVIESLRRTVDVPLARLLLPPEEQAGAIAALGNGSFLLRALREVPGRFLGNPGSGRRGILRGLDETLQAARAECISLWLLHHPRLLELHWLQPGEPELLQLFWAAAAVARQALARGEISDPQELGLRLVVRHLVEKAQVVSIQKRGGRLFVTIPDREAFQREVGSLLTRLDRIRRQGRRTQALSWIERFGAPCAWPELDALEKQLRAGGMRRLCACLMPRLTPIKDDAGKALDAGISYEESMEQQVLRLRRY
jgi:dipeptidyl-peptidase-3